MSRVKLKRVCSLPAAMVGMLLCAATFTACSDNDTSTASALKIERSDISLAYEGYEQLEGRDMGSFVMPREIKPISFEGLYRFTINKQTEELYDNKALGEEVFARFFGEGFDESSCRFTEYEGEKRYEYYIGDELCASFYCGEVMLCSPDMGTETALTSAPQELSLSSDSERELALADGSFTLGEVIESTSDRLYELIGDVFKEYTFSPVSIYQIETDKGSCVRIVYSLCLEGVPIEALPSPLFTLSYENGMEMQESYMIRNITVDASGNAVRYLNAMAPFTFYEKEQLDTAVSLEGAVDILKQTLAEYTDYELESVTLEYCSKSKMPSVTTEADLGDSEAESSRREIVHSMHNEFVPTWCFAVGGEQSGRFNIKVNAITGEITIDR